MPPDPRHPGPGGGRRDAGRSSSSRASCPAPASSKPWTYLSSRSRVLTLRELPQLARGAVEHRSRPQLTASARSSVSSASATRSVTGVKARPLKRAISGPTAAAPGSASAREQQQRGGPRAADASTAARQRCGPWSTAGWPGRSSPEVDQVGEPVGGAGESPVRVRAEASATLATPSTKVAPARRPPARSRPGRRGLTPRPCSSQAARLRRRTTNAVCEAAPRLRDVAWARSSSSRADAGRRRRQRPGRPSRGAQPDGVPGCRWLAPMPRWRPRSRRGSGRPSRAPSRRGRLRRVGIRAGDLERLVGQLAREVQVTDEAGGLGSTAEDRHPIGVVGQARVGRQLERPGPELPQIPPCGGSSSGDRDADAHVVAAVGQGDVSSCPQVVELVAQQPVCGRLVGPVRRLPQIRRPGRGSGPGSAPRRQRARPRGAARRSGTPAP